MSSTHKPSENLRVGYTTGTCCTAGALAAWASLHGDYLSTVNVHFPDGSTHTLPVEHLETGHASIIKDAGDDIDCTDGAHISAHITGTSLTEVNESDFILPCGKATIILRGGSGIGTVTRKGLEVPPGKAAINPVPRQMIIDNLSTAGLGDTSGVWLIELTIEHGEKLANKTLNPTLGIVGGLSILGTSGYVIPCSNKAYISTIHTLLNGAHLAGEKTAILVTGGKTHKVLRRLYPDVDECAFVRFGDFIQDALEACSRHHMETAIIGCMPGKLAKYALGRTYTHAHTVAQSMNLLADTLERDGFPPGIVESCRSTQSVREFLCSIEPEAQACVLDLLKEKAVTHLSNWAATCRCELVVIGFNEEVL